MTCAGFKWGPPLAFPLQEPNPLQAASAAGSFFVSSWRQPHKKPHKTSQNHKEKPTPQPSWTSKDTTAARCLFTVSLSQYSYLNRLSKSAKLHQRHINVVNPKIESHHFDSFWDLLLPCNRRTYQVIKSLLNSYPTCRIKRFQKGWSWWSLQKFSKRPAFIAEGLKKGPRTSQGNWWEVGWTRLPCRNEAFRCH